jgi:hypothetical protein
MDVSRFFAPDYREARRKFLASAEKAGAELDHFRHPTEKAPDGGPLYMDTAWFGPKDAPVVLLALSGTHGAEGFAGSAAQIQWMEEGTQKRLPKGVAVLKVHAVNPFGFAHMIRVSEGNVDLNRNWIDYTKPVPPNPIFDEVEAALPTREGYDEALVDEHIAAAKPFYEKYGDWKMSDALSRGQYRHPDGTQFGGLKREWSTHTLDYIIRTKLTHARHVAYIDWHTLIRIGDGNFVYLCFNQIGDPLHQRVGSWYGAETIDRKTINKQWGDGVARSGGRPGRYGLLFWGLQHILAPQTDIAGSVIEFCANKEEHNDPLRHRIQLQLKSRWLFRNRRYDSKEGKAIVEELRDNTTPLRKDWEEKALISARATYDRILSGAGAWAAENAPVAPGKLTLFDPGGEAA